MRPYIVPTKFVAVDLMTGPIGRMQRAMLGLTTLSGAHGARMQRGLQDIGDKAMMVAGNAAMIGAAALLPLGLATHAAMKFEKQMTNVATLMDTSKESVSEFSEAVLAMGANTPVPLADLTQSLYQIRSEGFKGAEAIDMLRQSSKLAVAGLSTVEEAAMSVSTAVRVFADEHRSAQQIADLFFKTVVVGRTTMSGINESFGVSAAIVHSAGVSLAEMMAITSALTNAGFTASAAMISLQGATMAMIKPSGAMEKIFAVLGVRTGPQLIKMMGGIVPAMNAIKEASARTGINVNEAFARVQGLRMYQQVTGPVRDQYEKDMAIMNDVDHVMVNEAYAKQLGTTSAQTEIAKNNLVILGVAVGNLLLPALTSLVQVLTPVVQGITSFAKEHTTLSKIIVGAIAIIGTYAAAVAVGGFLIGTVTKATWLWVSVTEALSFAKGILCYVLGMENTLVHSNIGALYGAAAAARVYALAAKYLSGSLTVLIAKLSIVTAGLALIYAYRKEIQNWANDSELGRSYNMAIGDKGAVSESLQRQYILDPAGTRAMVEKHTRMRNGGHTEFMGTSQKGSGINTDSLFAAIDRGEKMGNSNDLLLEQRKYDSAAKNQPTLDELTRTMRELTDTMRNKGIKLNIDGKTYSEGDPIPVPVKTTGRFR